MHSFFDLTHFRELGQKYKNIFVGFWFKWKLSYLLSILTDLYLGLLRAKRNEEAKEEAVKETVSGTIFGQFKSYLDSSKILNPDPNFKLVDTHTLFFHFLLATQAKGNEPANAADICLPKVIFQNLSKIYTWDKWTSERVTVKTVTENLLTQFSATVLITVAKIVNFFDTFFRHQKRGSSLVWNPTTCR